MQIILQLHLYLPYIHIVVVKIRLLSRQAKTFVQVDSICDEFPVSPIPVMRIDLKFVQAEKFFSSVAT